MQFDLHTQSVRSKLIIERTKAAIHNSNLDVQSFAVRVADRYLSTVAPFDRVTKFRAIEGDIDTMNRAKIRNGELTLHYIKGAIKFPCDLEEAWVDSLPEPWRSDLIRELAARYGLLGVRKADLSPPQHLAAFGDVLADVGKATQSIAPILADGRISADDAPHCTKAITDIDRTVADLLSVRMQLQAVQPRTETVSPRAAG